MIEVKTLFRVLSSWIIRQKKSVLLLSKAFTNILIIDKIIYKNEKTNLSNFILYIFIIWKTIRFESKRIQRATKSSKLLFVIKTIYELQNLRFRTNRLQEQKEFVEQYCFDFAKFKVIVKY